MTNLFSFPFQRVMRKIKDISTVIILIGAMLFSGDIMAYQAFSHASSSESRIEVESIEEVEVRDLVTRYRRVAKVGYQSRKHTRNLSSSFNPIFIEKTTGVKRPSIPRFIQFCTFLQ